jgi:5-methyltetrahydropteroyltriglutamate--homocysteine methyltransferase
MLVSHVGLLPRPSALDEVLAAEGASQAQFERVLSGAVGKVVGRQSDRGIDAVNDGEFSKPEGFSRYVTERIGGIEPREPGPGDARRHPDARDRREFPGFYARAPERAVSFQRPVGRPGRRRTWTCAGPLSYLGHERVRADIDRLQAATRGTQAEPFLTAVAPGTIEHWLSSDHYADDESFLMAIAETTRVEYKDVTDAGIVLQIDDPHLPDGWQAHPEMDLAAYRSYAALRIDALNQGLKGIPGDLVRLHVCCGSCHGPHKNDIPLAAITDLILSVPAACYSAAHTRNGRSLHRLDRTSRSRCSPDRAHGAT